MQIISIFLVNKQSGEYPWVKVKKYNCIKDHSNIFVHATLSDAETTLEKKLGLNWIPRQTPWSLWFSQLLYHLSCSLKSVVFWKPKLSLNKNTVTILLTQIPILEKLKLLLWNGHVVLMPEINDFRPPNERRKINSMENLRRNTQFSFQWKEK